MKVIIEFARDLYSYSKYKFLVSIVFMILSSITNGIGIVMLVPLLSLAGITGESSIRILGLDEVILFLKQYSSVTQLLIVLFIYILLIIIEAVINRKSSILNTEIIQGYTRYLRVVLYEETIKAEWTCLIDKKKSDITNSFTVEINRIAAGTIYFLRIISQFILSLAQVYIAFLMSSTLTIFVIACGIAIFIFMNNTLKESKRLGASLQCINKELLSEITEQLNGIKEIKSYGIEKTQLEVFNEITSKVEDNMVSFVKIQSKPVAYYKISAAVVISMFFYLSINYFNITPVSMIVIIFIFARLWPIFSSFQSDLQNIFGMMPAFISLKELSSELKANKENIYFSSNGCDSGKLVLQNCVKFNNISFNYRDNSQGFKLRNISFEIPSRKITAFVGRSGAGKSTIVDLLLGLIKPNDGYISIDDNIIEETLVSSWRNAIGYVPQDSFLLNTTIKENLLRFNQRATEEEVYEALELSAAKEFIEKLPDGIETIIGDRGVKLSGGERQRIVLARALIRKPQVLVLDEATSALDNENEYKIQNAVEGLKGKITVVIIAHRLSTIKNADNIIVVDNGEVVEQGSYKNLESKDGGVFRRFLQVNNIEI